ncbi:MAG: PAS domain-containing protein [Pyrinomonadaceae bacterium]|nr:PAS domain-containing protein [Pyrinomonadaceae bacterium]
MNYRLMLALTLGAALLISIFTLFYWSPPLALVALAFALAGALAARFLPPGRKTNKALSQPFDRNAGGEGATAVASGQTAGAQLSSPLLKNNPALLPDTVPAGDLLEAMLNSMREGMLVVDGELRVLASNPASDNLFGAAEGKTLRARRLSDLTRNPAVLSAFLAAVERGERVEVKVETLEPASRAFDLRVAPLQSRQPRKNGEERGAVGIFFDITRIERLERVRQEFLSNVSHELRTPLTAILAFVETLEDGAIDDPTNNRRFLTIIERNAARMHSLIDDILELSAIEAGTAQVETGLVRLRSLVDDVLTALAASAAERRVTLHNDVSAEVFVAADARRLEQMITNLADNAVKFNREGGHVRVGHEQTAGRDRITVADTGEGISPEHIHRIFERFYRVDRARSRALGGTGLGLAIVKHLARAHNGEATVISTPGEGSTFAIELPKSELATLER